MKNPDHLSLIAILTSMTLVGLPITAAPVDLGTAADFVVMGKTAITTTGPTSIVGNIGISPAAASSMTGFAPILDASGEFATSSLIDGRIFAADYTPPTPSYLTSAILDMEAAYNQTAGLMNPDFTNLSGGILIGETLTPGLYKWTSGVTITDTLTLDGGGDPNAVWSFQVDNRLVLASGAEILLTNGANFDNIFWQAAEGASLGTYSHFEGNLLTKTDISATNGASINGRLLAQTAVTLDGNYISAVPEPSAIASILAPLGLGVILFLRRRLRAKA